ncbi:hypothetical protein FHR81_004466 [Actinoalloteichus hoggarensis]|uniref:Uncharacterized protein n=1 Tax=Actinoalloteichus hoggarensis TaxID=1470176 RepID=A0A221W3Y3_9PSEU|nr:DUF5313 family protein [Actinoalloteichus hoggarensis]ASO20357.1 hypothetical protein AHOG_13570 [Actinoalloteichus hoggarensis]MBB5923395.1 hypothetical protein [Actinoalloteichus hoggarensis]
MSRPNPIQWLWYALGGRLPERLRPWVLHDVTCKTWVWRHAARGTVLLGPVTILCLLIPAPLEIRLCMGGLASIVGYYFYFSYVEESCELRASKHGYAYGIARSTREAAHAEANAAARARYLAIYRPTAPAAAPTRHETAPDRLTQD